jgi:hypothetical protein
MQKDPREVFTPVWQGFGQKELQQKVFTYTCKNKGRSTRTVKKRKLKMI